MGIGTDVVVFRRRRYDMMMIDHHKSHGSNVYRYVLGDCEIVSSWTFSFSQPPPSCDWSLSSPHGCVWSLDDDVVCTCTINDVWDDFVG